MQKILRSVQFDMKLDVTNFCNDKLRSRIGKFRKLKMEAEDEIREQNQKKGIKLENDKNDKNDKKDKKDKKEDTKTKTEKNDETNDKNDKNDKNDNTSNDNNESKAKSDETDEKKVCVESMLFLLFCFLKFYFDCFVFRVCV